MKSMIVGLVVLLLVASKSEAGIIITPGPSVTINTVPFGGTEDVRYQQIYGASLFTTFSFGGQAPVAGPIEISGLQFSPNKNGVFEADVTIRLIQTTTSVGSLSPVLDNNFSGSLTTVFQDSFFSQAVNGGDLTYSLRFDFLQPFLYDPTGGANLLVDIVVKNKTDGWAFYRGNGQGVTSRATDGSADNNGLRTLITYEPASVTIPEPASLAIWVSLSFAAGVTGRMRCRRTSGSFVLAA